MLLIQTMAPAPMVHQAIGAIWAWLIIQHIFGLADLILKVRQIAVLIIAKALPH